MLVRCQNPILARWQSGYAAACKAVDAGSIPTLASTNPFKASKNTHETRQVRVFCCLSCSGKINRAEQD